MRLIVLVVALLVLAGCASAPEPMPRPAPTPTPVLCALPEGQAVREPEPERPAGNYTQRDVALYVERLHRWGSRGWARLMAAQNWSDGCVNRAAVRDSGATR